MFKFLITDKRYQLLNALLIALSASFLCIETFCVTHVNYTENGIYVVTFFTTWYAYFNYKNEKKFSAKQFQQFVQLKKIIGNPFFDSIVGFILITVFFIDSLQSFFILLAIAMLSCIYFRVAVFKFSFNIRKIYFAKTFLLALIWSITTVMLPLSFAHENLLSTVALLIFARRFLFIAALTIPFEIRDIHKDAALGDKSFVNLIGVGNSKIIAMVLLLIYLALVLIQFEMNQLGVNLIVAMFISISLSAILILIYDADKKQANLILLFTDAMLMVQFLLIEIAIRI